MHIAVPETAKALTTPTPTPTGAPRGEVWKWYICVLLLLATSLNYIDRLALNLQAKPMMRVLDFNEEGYGLVESAFGFAFAIGAILFGWLADRINVRWLYALAVLAWSASGFLTGLAQTFAVLLLCRAALGLFESGNWPSALRTTQRILPPHQRALGNSILQSGAAIGAILTPLIVEWLVPEEHPELWGIPFVVVGVLGLAWVAFWLPSVRRQDLQMPPPAAGPSLMSVLAWLLPLAVVFFAVRALIRAPEFAWVGLVVQTLVTGVGIAVVYRWLKRATEDDDKLPRPLFLRRFWVLVVLVVSINTLWHFLRAWLPLILVDQLGYNQKEMRGIVLAYNIATDVGSLTSGFVALGLVRLGFSVHNSRALVFLGCALLGALTALLAFLPAGPLLIGMLMVIGMGALGVFPVYYSFSQELTVKHQGKVTGSLGCICWLAMALLHALVGNVVKQTQSYSLALPLVAVVPLAACVVLFLVWKPDAAKQPEAGVGGS
jgi:ACS family hexuronate transporter-like MFS transporter